MLGPATREACGSGRFEGDFGCGAAAQFCSCSLKLPE